MWVVKLGGSLLDYSGLSDWLEALANAPRPVVIVVGGGPLADAVRNAQKQWNFTDSVAHHMGLFAMEQNASFLASLDSRVDPCADEYSIQKSLDSGKVPVWLPVKMVMAAQDIVQDWTMTSDSLSVWFANQLSAAGMLLVKSCSIPSGRIIASQLSNHEVVDQAFPAMAAQASYPIRIMQRENYLQLDDLLTGRGCDALSVS